ncbi:hypothetical protein [Tardiphaga sp.]|jgi:hypothetical protein|uniref:hypothetical protein n=1 Tax=Tardiphaga sp. TaxID=1926292 RepID=UPI0037D9DBD3
MNRKIVRTYKFSDREVNEALIAMLKARDIQAPQYVGETPCTTWIKEPDGIRVEWSDETDLDIC